MGSEIYDVTVVGAGIMGLWTAYDLAKNGHKTLLVDQFILPHERGSSGGQSRIIRLYYDTDLYARMMTEAYQLWRQLEKATNEELIITTGMLALGDGKRGTKRIRDSSNVMKRLNVKHDIFGPDELRQRFPMLRHGKDTYGLYDAEAAILLVAKCNRTLLEEFRRHGGILRDGQKVTKIIPGEIVSVETPRGQYRSRRLVLTPGPWAKDVMSGLGVDLPLSTLPGRPCFWKEKVPGNCSIESGMPIFVHDLDVENGYQFVYAFPSCEYPGMIKMGTRGEPALQEAHPDDRDKPNQEKVIAQISRYIQEHMPGVETTPSIMEAGMYTRTPDGDFIIDRHPRYPNILIGAGGSGHAYKNGPIIGKLLTQMVEGAATSYDITPFRISRFKSKL